MDISFATVTVTGLWQICNLPQNVKYSSLTLEQIINLFQPVINPVETQNIASLRKGFSLRP